MAALSALAAYDVSDDDADHEAGHEDGHVGIIVKQPTPPEPNLKNGQQRQKKSPIDDEDIFELEESFFAVKDDVVEDVEMSEVAEGGEEDAVVTEENNNNINEDGDGEEAQENEEGKELTNGESEAKAPAKLSRKRYSCENATAFALKLRTLAQEELELPPEPLGQCTAKLQERFQKLYERKLREGENINRALQARKDFRNPSMYEKFLDFLGIEERGTNLPRKEYDPESWRKCPSYEELARAQREDLAKKEKDKKTKVEFVTAVKKSASSGSGSGDRAKRTKWDDRPPTSNAKTTIISAVGSIKKPKV